LRPTSKCNYNCYYCTDLHINSNPIFNLPIENLLQLIDTAYSKVNMKIHVFICGGEPTLYNEIQTLLKTLMLHMVNIGRITVQTNMSRSVKWFENLCSKLPLHLNNLQINGSYHNTQDGVKITDYIKKCMFLKGNNILGMVSFGYNKHLNVIKDYRRAVKLLGSEHCEITPLINASVDQHPGKGNGSGSDIDHIYKVENMSDLETTGHFFSKTLPYETISGEHKKTSRADMWLTRNNNFISYKCAVSKYKLYVDWDGNCYKCFNEQFSPVKPAFHITQINPMQEYFNDMKCMLCPFTTCFFDLEYEKIKSNEVVEEIKIDRKYNTNEYRQQRID